jgi:hypothetical protein
MSVGAGRRQAEQQRAGVVLPQPREILREAHQARAVAQGEVDRLRQVVDRARQHLVEVTATRDEAKNTLEIVEAEHAARLIDELVANGEAGRVEPAAGEKRVALAEAEHQVEIATRAAAKLNDRAACPAPHTRGKKPGFWVWDGEIPRDADCPLERAGFEPSVPGESGFGFAPEEPNAGIQLSPAASRAKSLSTARSLQRTCR